MRLVDFDVLMADFSNFRDLGNFCGGFFELFSSNVLGQKAPPAGDFVVFGASRSVGTDFQWSQLCSDLVR